jgi:hypothetical protein
MIEARCCVLIWHRFTTTQCTRAAKVEREGRGYCKQHDPESVRVRRAKAHAIWKERRALEERCRIANTVVHANERRVITAAKLVRDQDGTLGDLVGEVRELVDAEKLARDARDAYAAFQKENPR